MKKTYTSRYVVPVTSQPIESGAVTVDESGTITYVGPQADAPPGELYDLGNSILLPGLINAHTHLELTFLRNKLEGLSFPEWIDRLRVLRMTGKLEDATLLESARLGIKEGLRAGITTYADTAFSGNVVLQAMLEARVRGIVYQEVFGPDPDQCYPSLADLTTKVLSLCEILDNSSDDKGIIRVGLAPHAPYTVSDALYNATAQWAFEAEIPLAMHIAEGIDEHKLVSEAAGVFAERLRARGVDVKPRGRSPVAMLDNVRALNPGSLLIHCVHVDDADIDTIKKRSCAVAHCPASNSMLGHGIAPVKKFLEANIPVGLGSDSMASNTRMNILEEAKLAIAFQNQLTGQPDTIALQTALELATIRGAQALGLADRIGSLEVGKDADLAAFPIPVPDPHLPSPVSPITAAIFSLSRTTPTPADFVAVKGSRIYPT